MITEPQQLVKYGLTWEQLVDALEANNQNVGGGQVVRSGESLLVHGLGLTTKVEEIANIVITSAEGVPVRVRDVAEVRLDHEIRRGAVTGGGKGEIVLGLGFMLMGENSAEVTCGLKARLAEVQQTLPKDVKVQVLYDRTESVNNVIQTVKHNLLAGALLVIAGPFAFLGNLRAGLVVAAAIPLSLLFAGDLMLQARESQQACSVCGAVDFGLIVDGSVVIVENAMRRLALRQHDLGQGADAGRARRDTGRRPPGGGPASGVRCWHHPHCVPANPYAGRRRGQNVQAHGPDNDFRSGRVPDSGADLNTGAGQFIPSQAGPGRRNHGWCGLSHRLYEPLLGLALRFRLITLLSASVVLVAVGILATRMGGEFLPKLGEGAIVGTTVRLAGISTEEAVAYNDRIEKLLLAGFPDEIANVWTRLGSAEMATDPDGD